MVLPRSGYYVGGARWYHVPWCASLQFRAAARECSSSLPYAPLLRARWCARVRHAHAHAEVCFGIPAGHRGEGRGGELQHESLHAGLHGPNSRRSPADPSPCRPCSEPELLRHSLQNIRTIHTDLPAPIHTHIATHTHTHTNTHKHTHTHNTDLRTHIHTCIGR